MCVKHEGIPMGLHGNRGAVHIEKHQEVEDGTEERERKAGLSR